MRGEPVPPLGWGMDTPTVPPCGGNELYLRAKEHHQMTATEFKPELVTGVFTYNTLGLHPTPVNPSLCASQKCGVELAEIFSPYNPIVFMDVPQRGVFRSPLADAGGKLVGTVPALRAVGPFYQIDPVAWLRFPNGAVVNCGVLAVWWISSAPTDAHRYAEAEIKGVIEARDKEVQAQEGRGE